MRDGTSIHTRLRCLPIRRPLGHYASVERDYDVWHCQETVLPGGSIIMRRSSRPDDYLSADVSLIRGSGSTLAQGLKLATSKGMVSPVAEATAVPDFALMPNGRIWSR